MKTLSKLAVAAAAVMVASCTTMATPPVRISGEDFDSRAAWATIDLNHDGSLSLDEAEQQRAMGLLQDFPNADTNHDDRISKEEWDHWWPRMTDHYVRESTTSDAPALDTAR